MKIGQIVSPTHVSDQIRSDQIRSDKKELQRPYHYKDAAAFVESFNINIWTLSFIDKDSNQSYVSYCRSVPLVNIDSICIFVFYVGCWISAMGSISTYGETLFNVSFAFEIYVWLAIVAVARANFTSIQRRKRNLSQSKFSRFIFVFCWWGHIEDSIAIFSSLSINLALIQRVLNGQCFDFEMSDFWKIQRCNPTSLNGALPQFHLILQLGTTSFLLVYLEAVTNFGIFFVCIINFTGLLLSTCLLGSWIIGSRVLVYSLLNTSVCCAVKISRMRTFALRKVMEERILAVTQNILANVAHDIKTPLRSIMLIFDEFIESSTNISTLDLPKLSKNGRSMSLMINTTTNILLDHVRLLSEESLTDPTELKKIVLEKLVYDIIDSTSWLTAEYSIKAEFRTTGRTMLQLDKRWLQEILLCLILNCANALNANSSDCMCSVVVECTQRIGFGSSMLVKITVFDNRQIPLVLSLDPSPTSEMGSLGIDLYIIKKRIEAVGGNFDCSRRTDSPDGMRFTCSFNAISIPSDRLVHYNPRATRLDTVSDREISHRIVSQQVNKGVILVVDDSNLTVKIIKRQLENLEYKVETASDGREALALSVSKNSQYCFILVDLQMPVMNGVEFTKCFRYFEKSLGRGSNRVPIVCMSATDIDITDSCIEAGMNAFFSKPFSIENFLTTVKLSL